jgi:hypothetical protein
VDVNGKRNDGFGRGWWLHGDDIAAMERPTREEVRFWREKRRELVVAARVLADCMLDLGSERGAGLVRTFASRFATADEVFRDVVADEARKATP